MIDVVVSAIAIGLTITLHILKFTGAIEVDYLVTVSPLICGIMTILSLRTIFLLFEILLGEKDEEN